MSVYRAKELEDGKLPVVKTVDPYQVRLEEPIAKPSLLEELNPFPAVMTTYSSPLLSVFALIYKVP